MSSKIVRIVIWGSVAIAVLVVLYIRNSRQQMDRAVTEANSLVDQCEVNRKKLESEAGELFRGSVPKELAGDREKLEKTVANFNERYMKNVADYRAAAAKFDEAEKAAKKESDSKYLELMSQAYQNFADGEEARRKALLLLVDKSIPSADELQQKHGALMDEARKLNGEFERLYDDAQKFHDENKPR